MENPFWHVREDFNSVTPEELVAQMWVDDELNRERSLVVFADEIALVNTGLALYIEPIQQSLITKSAWQDNDCQRAGIAMLVHAFDTFLARRHLLTNGYLSESRHFGRSTYEALCQSLAFVENESLAKKFYEGRQINPKEIHKALSKSFSDETNDIQDVYKQFSDPYIRLSRGSHPTLDSFSFRTAVQESGNAGLRKGVPEDVVFGGLLQDDIGRILWHALARGIGEALATVRYVISGVSSEWVKQSQEYRARVEKLIANHDAKLDEG